jgi:hypothetical protein
MRRVREDAPIDGSTGLANNEINESGEGRLPAEQWGEGGGVGNSEKGRKEGKRKGKKTVVCRKLKKKKKK